MRKQITDHIDAVRARISAAKDEIREAEAATELLVGALIEREVEGLSEDLAIKERLERIDGQPPKVPN